MVQAEGAQRVGAGLQIWLSRDSNSPRCRLSLPEASKVLNPFVERWQGNHLVGARHAAPKSFERTTERDRSGLEHRSPQDERFDSSFYSPHEPDRRLLPIRSKIRLHRMVHRTDSDFDLAVVRLSCCQRL